MEWIAQNWVWVLFTVGMIAMHLFGHGGHGGHGDGPNDAKPANKDSRLTTSEPGPGQRH